MLGRVILEAACAAIVCGGIGRIADVDGHSPLAWAGLTLVLCLASLMLPVPVLRLVLAGYTAFALMFLYNLFRPLPR